MVRQGVCYVPQTENVFPNLSVNENLEMGAYIRTDDFRPRMDEMYELFPPLAERRRAPAGTLSGGQRQMVAIAKALMVDPVILLLDEPTAGLSPRFRGDIFRVVREINARGTPILMVEQNARQALGIADRGYVLVDGRNRMEGTGPGLLADPDVGAMFSAAVAIRTPKCRSTMPARARARARAADTAASSRTRGLTRTPPFAGPAHMRAGAAGMPMRKGESRPTVRARMDAMVARAWIRPPAPRLGIRNRPTVIEFVNFYLIPGLVLGSIYALGAIGVTLTFGILRFANFAHGETMTLGAYFTLTLTAFTGLHPLLFLPIAMALTALAVLGIDRLFFRPASPRPDHHPRHCLVRADADGALLRADRLGREAPVVQQGHRPSWVLFDTFRIFPSTSSSSAPPCC